MKLDDMPIELRELECERLTHQGYYEDFMRRWFKSGKTDKDALEFAKGHLSNVNSYRHKIDEWYEANPWFVKMA